MRNSIEQVELRLRWIIVKGLKHIGMKSLSGLFKFEFI